MFNVMHTQMSMHTHTQMRPNKLDFDLHIKGCMLRSIMLTSHHQTNAMLYPGIAPLISEHCHEVKQSSFHQKKETTAKR